MQLLKHIETKICPECGCSDIEKEWTRSEQHVNGEQREGRNWRCGYTIEWVPNFSKEQKGHWNQCTKSIDYIDEQAKIKSIQGKIRTLLVRSGLSVKARREVLCIQVD